MNHPYFILTLKYKDLNIYLLRDVFGFFKNQYNTIPLNIPFKKLVLPGKVKCGGTEGKIVVAHGCRKRKKLICGPEEEIVVAHGRLPSPAPHKPVFFSPDFPIH